MQTNCIYASKAKEQTILFNFFLFSNSIFTTFFDKNFFALLHIFLGVGVLELFSSIFPVQEFFWVIVQTPPPPLLKNKNKWFVPKGWVTSTTQAQAICAE